MKGRQHGLMMASSPVLRTRRALHESSACGKTDTRICACKSSARRRVLIFAIWIGFGALFLFLVLLDLGVFSKKVETIKAKEALGRTLVWVLLALAFVPVVYFLYEN